jgi:hypothetical protein
MIGGPVTAMPTMILFWTIFKKRVFFLYMTVCILGSIAISFAFQTFIFVPGVDTGNPLLKGVSSLPGGVSTTIHKKNKHVRIVMESEGQNLIAFYNNDADGSGGVVFDAGSTRFQDGTADLYDNGKYIGNLAEWLGENSSFPAQKNILLYSVTSQTGAGGNSYKSVSKRLEQRGFSVITTNSNEPPVISERLLADFSQIWMMCGASDSSRQITDAERDAIARFVEEGKSMLIVSGAPDDDSYDMPAANQLSSRFGVVFKDVARNGEELPVGIGSQILNKMSGLLGKVLKMVHKA